METGAMYKILNTRYGNGASVVVRAGNALAHAKGSSCQLNTTKENV